jgi:segregation and condensation protein B
MKLLQSIEAVLFASDKPLTIKDLEIIFQHTSLQHLQVTREDIENVLSLIEQKYNGAEYPIMLKKVNGGYQFFTKPEYHEAVRVATLHKEKKKLSKSALETLSIIAYQQPITKSEIEHIRGVNSDYAIQRLLEAQLIEIAGRADMPGKPLLYRTSDAFFDYFKINSLKDLPKLNEINDNEENFTETFKNPINPEISLN